MFPAKLLLWMLLPPLLLALEAAFLASLYCVLITRKNQKRRNSSLAGNTDEVTSDENRALRQKLQGWFITGFAVSFFTLQGSLSTVTFQAFSCMQVDAEGKIFALSSDASFPCYDSSYYYLLYTQAVPMLVLYVISLPLIAAVYISRKIQRNQPHNLSFLSNGFNSKKFPDGAWFYIVGLREVQNNCFFNAYRVGLITCIEFHNSGGIVLHPNVLCGEVCPPADADSRAAYVGTCASSRLQSL